MLSGSLKVELWRFIGVLFVCVIVGLILSRTAEFIAFGSTLYVLWLLLCFYRIEDWINRTRRLNAPPKNNFKGLCADISYNIESIFGRHKKQKNRLKKAVRRVRKMGLALSDGVILLDNNENIEWWNKEAELLFDLKPQDFGYKLTNIIRHPDFVGYFDSKNFNNPIQLPLSQKDRHIEIKIHTFGKKEKLVFVRDVTRLYKLELMRKDFVANVSHELRTPLTVIRGYVETFSECEIPREWAKAFKQMGQQCVRMDVLISDLITLSKLETDVKTTGHGSVYVYGLLETIISGLNGLVGDKKIVVNCDKKLEIQGNKSELSSALSNLVTNAINYSNEKAQITIDGETQDNEVIIRVTDTGIGIDPIHIPRLTERFYRVDSSRTVTTGGTGLGLAIVKHVLLRHNAKLTITSKLGKGSVFSCHFPKPTKR